MFPLLLVRIKGVSMENLWLKKVKEALEIASNRYRTQNRRAGPGGDSQRNPQNLAYSRG